MAIQVKMDSRSLFFFLFITIVTFMIFYVLAQYSSLTSSSDITFDVKSNDDISSLTSSSDITFDVKSNDDIVLVETPDRVSYQSVGSPSTPGKCITTIEEGYPYNELNYVFYSNDADQIDTTFYCRVLNKSDRSVKILSDGKRLHELPPNYEF